MAATEMGVTAESSTLAPGANALDESDVGSDTNPQSGDPIDRFVVIEAIGAGGMAYVVSAYDAALDRKVALKLLRPEVWRGGKAGTQGKQRLLREAQAMARLAHPNVVAVHQAGTYRGQIYLAMEHVDGQTLTRWLCDAPRTWREIVDIFAQAGRGLAAAHAAGMVHRDFKPDNVLVGRDGRPRVGDFGLVSAAGAPVDDSSPSWSDTAPPPLSSSLTRTGALLGTPAYMSPEQHARTSVDARSDQFGFCVALWEALYGERPFPGDTYKTLLDNIRSGRLREPPASSEVPGWLRQVLLRGLSAEPDDRHDDMNALLEALAADPEAARTRRWRRAGLAAAFVALAGVAIGGLGRDGHALSPCDGAASELDGAWGAAQRAGIAAAFRGSGRSYAAETFDRVTRDLDAYSRDWIALRQEVCESTHVRGRQSQVVMDLRVRCLDRRRAALDALTTLLSAAPDPELVDRSLDAVAALPALSECSDIDALTAAVPLPASPEQRRAIEATDAAIDRAEALLGTGKYQQAGPVAEAAANAARELDYAPLRARALFVHGRARLSLDDGDGAAALLDEALRTAAAARDDVLVTRAWLELMKTRAAMGHYDKALELRAAVDVALTRAGGDELLRAAADHEIGTVLWSLGRYEEAQRVLGHALALREERRAPDHTEVADSLESLGNVLAERGDYQAALAHLERARTIRERASGPHHPRTAGALNDLALVLRDLGREAEALPYLERALAIFEEALGPDAADVARLRNNLGLIHSELGNLDAAAEAFRRALAGKEASLGPSHPSTALSLNNLAATLAELDRPAEALPLVRRALAIYEDSLGAEHPDTARAHATLAGAMRSAGDYAQARGHYQRARAIWEQAVGADHMEVSFALMGMAACELASGHRAAAVPLLERALAIREANPGRLEPLAEARWLLARTLVALGRDRPRALALASDARDTFAAAAAQDGTGARVRPRQLADAIGAWLAAGARAADAPGARGSDDAGVR